MRRSGTFIALLRGINVGGRNAIPMSGLRALCEELGWESVRTYIQSGNVVFRANGSAADLARRLEEAIRNRFGLSIAVVVRSATAWHDYLEQNPFAEACETRPALVMVALTQGPPAAEAAERIQERAGAGEQVSRVGDAVWIHYPNGAGRSKITPGLLDKHVGSPVTTRNWRTVVKLDEIAGEVAKTRGPA